MQPFTAIGQQQTKASAAPTATPQAPVNYERFTHQTHLVVVKVPGTFNAHELKCDSCHDQRDLMKNVVPTTERNQEKRLKFPGHKACVECHVRQFTSQPQQTCTICHYTKQGLTARPPQRDFQFRKSFNAFFDSKQHDTHIAYKLPNGEKTDCNSCHKPTDKPAPLGVAAHLECYACHSPTSGDQKAAQKSGCIVCHTEQRTDDVPVYGRPSKAFGAFFTHKTHIGYANNDCIVCHTISGGYKQNSPASLKITAHASAEQRAGKGCFSCHDGGQHYGRTVFSGEPGSTGGGSCAKCHNREDGKVTPSSGLK
ncbi:MAG: cytochrome c3 family protein [Blastocatellia bacterium]